MDKIQLFAEELAKETKIKNFLEKENLSVTDVRKHYNAFRNFNEKSHCMGCNTYSSNPNDHQLLFQLEVNGNGHINTMWVKCKFLKQKELSEEYRKNFIINQVSEKMFQLTVESLDITPERSPFLSLFKQILGGKKLKKFPYIYGKPGIGKTACMFALANDLAKKNHKVAFVMVPELVRMVKSSWNNENIGIENIISQLKIVEYLFLDDIGGEPVTEWFRDETLLTILESRMQNNRNTLFTSNFSIEELAKKYAKTTKGDYSIDKSLRLVERIKALSKDVRLIGQSYRY